MTTFWFIFHILVLVIMNHFNKCRIRDKHFSSNLHESMLHYIAKTYDNSFLNFMELYWMFYKRYHFVIRSWLYTYITNSSGLSAIATRPLKIVWREWHMGDAILIYLSHRLLPLKTRLNTGTFYWPYLRPLLPKKYFLIVL